MIAAKEMAKTTPMTATIAPETAPRSAEAALIGVTCGIRRKGGSVPTNGCDAKGLREFAVSGKRMEGVWNPYGT